MGNIRSNKRNLTHLSLCNSLVGERWLEAYELVRGMTEFYPNERPFANDVRDNVFFKTEAERCELINLA